MKRREAKKIIDAAIQKSLSSPIRKDWITIRGTHVEVDDDNNIVSGPSNLKARNGTGAGKSKSDSSGKANSKSKSKIKDGKIPNMGLMDKEERTELQKEIVKIPPEKRQPQLEDFELKGLKEGNRYSFSHLLADYYPDFCEEIGYDHRERQNRYNTWVDYEDGIFTVRDKNNNKYSFSDKMRFRSAEAY